MADIIFEAPIMTKKLNFLDPTLYAILSRNREVLKFNGSLESIDNEQEWDKHVSNLDQSIKNGIVYFRPYGSAELNVLIDNQPVEQSILDFIICSYGRVKNAYLDNKDAILISISNNFAYSKEVVEKIFLDLVSIFQIEINYQYC